jgi:transcriptional regulator with XRE-family HTH domain
MLPLKVVQEVKRLLDEKHNSQRKIAKLLGISRGTVHAIASGKRGIHGREQDDNEELDQASTVRCPGCGARVYLPCVLCKARAYNLKRELLKSPSPHGTRRVA